MHRQAAGCTFCSMLWKIMSKPYAAFAVAHDTQKRSYMYPLDPPPIPFTRISLAVTESEPPERPPSMSELLFEKTYAYPAKSLHSNILEWLTPKLVLATELGLDDTVTVTGSNNSSPLGSLATRIPLFDYNELIRCPRFVRGDAMVDTSHNPDSQCSFTSSGGDSSILPSTQEVQLTPPHSSQTTPRYTPATVDLTPPRRILIYNNDDEALVLLERYTHNNRIYQKPQRRPIQLGTPAVLRPIRLMPSLATILLDELDFLAIIDLEIKGAPTKKHWVPNNTTANCMKCYHQFAVIPLIGQGCLRHHCRVCGGLYCSQCISTDSKVTIDRQARFVYNVTGAVAAAKVCHRCVGIYHRLQSEVRNRKLTTPIKVANPFTQKFLSLVLSDGDDPRPCSDRRPTKRSSISLDEGILWLSF